uniref:R-spondin 3 n=1 Tax=Laticauda laticaudata TaxID=8630 RepID=A0A8C5RSG5_LATLA
ISYLIFLLSFFFLQACQGGCATCSEYNGCMSCKPRLFFFLKRSHMKQTGMCFSSCPPGYFGQRSPERNECMKCKADCEACFNQNFCTKCKNGFYLHLGKCLENCPDWLEPNNHTMECNDIVHCKINEWSQWSPCTKNGKACGFKRGNETRVREILQLPSTKGKLCPHTSETRTCVVQKKNCQKGGKGTSDYYCQIVLSNENQFHIMFISPTFLLGLNCSFALIKKK